MFRREIVNDRDDKAIEKLYPQENVQRVGVLKVEHNNHENDTINVIIDTHSLQMFSKFIGCGNVSTGEATKEKKPWPKTILLYVFPERKPG
jgi:hypothetical protein